jgi:hypothetical protein
MLKGINKNIIEISDTGNDCFERAILFLRPGREHGEEQLRSQAKTFLAGLKLRRQMLWHWSWSSCLRLLAAAGAGAGVMALLMMLFY